MKAKRNVITGLILLTALFVLGGVAHANTVYNYTGNAMTCSGSCPANPLTLNGTITLSSALAPNLFFGSVTPLSYDFVVTGGAFSSQHFTQSDIGDTFFFSTNAAGVITGWQISFAGTLQTSFSQDNNGSGGDSYSNATGAAFAARNSSPGAWTVGTANPVPEPASLIMLSSGLVGFAGMLRRKLR